MIRVSDASVKRDDEVLLPSTDLTVAPGEIVALRGENGSGKTTLLGLIAGHTMPTEGSVLIAGRPPDRRRRDFRRMVAGQLTTPPFARQLTLAEHLALIAATWGSKPEASVDAAAEILEELGIRGLAKRFPHELSSGQAQLAALAIAFVRPFDVLLLDEPEQRLDDRRGAVVAAVLRRFREEGRTVVLATHSDDLVRSTSATVFQLAA